MGIGLLLGMGIPLCADPTFTGRQAFMGGNGLCVHAFLFYYLHDDATSPSFSWKA